MQSIPRPRYPCVATELPEGKYSRLCKCPNGDWPEHDEDVLKQLAERMKDSREKQASRDEPGEVLRMVMSGYVYFGQFIDHDVTRDNTSFKDASPNVEDTDNYRTTRLDLDMLYGKDPASVPCIYEGHTGRLLLDSPEAMKGIDGVTIGGSPDDLHRVNGAAVVVDPRQDENLIVAQLHVLFAKFHNRALKLLSEQPEMSVGPDDLPNRLERARRFVTWHYQWLILNDFLPRIVRQVILDDIRQDRFRLFSRRYTPSDDPVCLPIEFAVAGFRFGHSMVQDSYMLNNQVGIRPSHDIIRMTNRGCGIKTSLPANYVIDWTRFFSNSPVVNRAQKIDTFITKALYGLPEQSVQSFRLQVMSPLSAPSPIMLPAAANAVEPAPANCPPNGTPLPEMTLRRGSKVRLPSGQEFAEFFNLPVNVPPEQMATPEDRDFFLANGLDTRTPLWYYILREAAVEPNPEPARPPKPVMQKLGTIGSHVVAEVLVQLLNADPASFVNMDRNWRPPTFTFGNSNRPRSITSMPDLVQFAQSN